MADETLTPARARTRGAVLAAAARVFAARGFHGASMQAIAEEAGYTQGAIYASFASKSELFLAVIDDRLDAQTSEVDAALAGAEASERLDAMNQIGAQRLEAADGGRQALLGLEFLLYVVRDDPHLRGALAQRYRAADEATRRALVHAVPDLAGVDEQALATLALTQSLLIEGLQVRLLADPALLTADAAAALIEQAMQAVGAALLERG